jgi:riboflavin kinase / FMN adenylyltransferase
MRLTFSGEGISGPCVLALGMFDGVHTGHAWLLRTAREWGLLEKLPVVVCTFMQHPLELIAPNAVPPMLSTVPERAARMAQLKADALAVLPFDREMMNMTPRKFVDLLVSRFSPRHVVVGFNYTFGQKGEGDAKLLKKMGKILGFDVHIVSPVQVDGQVVSSSRVRSLLEQGNVEHAWKLLERPYAISGLVESGKGLGRNLGFPTANVSIPKHKALPAFGIYVARVKTGDGMFPAVVSLGRHPTLPEGGITLEAHLLNCTLNLYGQKIRVKFLKRLREEIKFAGVQSLKAQIERDVQETKAYFNLP